MLGNVQGQKKPSDFEIHVADPVKQGESVGVSFVYVLVCRSIEGNDLIGHCVVCGRFMYHTRSGRKHQCHSTKALKVKSSADSEIFHGFMTRSMRGTKALLYLHFQKRMLYRSIKCPQNLLSRGDELWKFSLTEW